MLRKSGPFGGLELEQEGGHFCEAKVTERSFGYPRRGFTEAKVQVQVQVQVQVRVKVAELTFYPNLHFRFAETSKGVTGTPFRLPPEGGF